MCKVYKENIHKCSDMVRVFLITALFAANKETICLLFIDLLHRISAGMKK